MKEKAFLACLLIGACLKNAIINSSAIATPAIDRTYAQSQNNPAQMPDLSKITLTVQDLPSGFTPFLEEEQQRKNFIDEILGGLQPETIFAFEKQAGDQQFQAVLGFTVQLPVELDRASFDAYVNQNNFAQKFIRTFDMQNQVNWEITARPLPDNIGKFSAGWTYRGTIYDIPLHIDAGMFARGKLVVGLLTVYVEGNNSIVPINELARKLDDRIIEQMPPASGASQ